MMAALLARRCALRGTGCMTLRAGSTVTHTATDHSHAKHAGKTSANPTVLNMVTGSVSKNHWHTNHPVEVAKHAREHVPHYIAAVQGVLGLPGPRAIAFENDETKQWTGLTFWESHSASQKAHDSEEHAKLMEGFGHLLDMDKMKEADVEMLHADFYYWAPIKECNYERYPLTVAVHNVKPGFRKFLRKTVGSNHDMAKWLIDIGSLFSAVTWNKAEDKMTVYTLYNDLLKYEAAMGEGAKKFEAWGFTEFMDLEGGAPAEVHSNCFMYSE